MSSLAKITGSQKPEAPGPELLRRLRRLPVPWVALRIVRCFGFYHPEAPNLSVRFARVGLASDFDRVDFRASGSTRISNHPVTRATKRAGGRS